MRNPLIITRHETLLDELLRLAAAAGVVPEVVPDAGAALRCWGAAPVVLVGTDLAEEMVRIGPPRRTGVQLIGWGGVPDEVFRLAVALGAENVAELPRSEGWVLELLADTGDNPPGESVTIGVLGGSGGSGATTFACCLGLAAARRGAACLIDTDPHGPGVDRVLGFDRMDGVRWDTLQQTTGRISARALRDALPRRHDLGVLTWPAGPEASLQPFAVREAMSAAARGHRVVVLDLPRTGGPLAEELMTRCSHLVLMVRATVPGLASAARMAALATRSGAVGLVVRGSAVDAPGVARVVGSARAGDDGRPTWSRGGRRPRARPTEIAPQRAGPGREPGPRRAGGQAPGGGARGVSSPVPARLLEEVRDSLARDGVPCTPHEVASALRAAGRPVGDATVLAVHDALRSESLGAGPLDPLLRLPGVTDVLVNGASQVWFDRGAGLELSSVRFPDEESVRRLAQRLASTGGRRLDDASPCVDVRLADGTRCHAVLAPVARPGSVISLRVPHRLGLSLADLRDRGALSEDGLRLVRRVVAAGLAFLISGGTGSGKTTLLSAMLGDVSPDARLVLVEDASELRPDHPHVVALEARPANIEGVGEIALRTLVRQALRMRPDRLVVGEVRGGEVVDLLAALNTGHEGGCGTIHANSAADVPARVEALALAAGLNRDAVHSQFGSAISVVLHLDRASDGRRLLREVGVPVRGLSGHVEIERAVGFDDDGTMTTGRAADRLAERLARC